MSIASEITRLQSAKSNLKTSIENKGVIVPSTTKIDGYASLVDQISTANTQSFTITENGTYTANGEIDGYDPVIVYVSDGSNSKSDAVRFFDYDGTLLHSYSVEEFVALNAMPANPTHTGLTSQGWNWTLVDAKAYVATYKMLDIGQMYITNDGKTRVYISLVDSRRLSPYLGICPNGTVVVDWGDNSATNTLTGTSLTTVQRAQHTYASTGNYVITLTVTNGSFAIYGTTSSSNGSYLLTKTNGIISSQRCYQNAIKKVELGANVSVGKAAFDYCYFLSSITIPSGVTSIDAYTFSNCYSLASITIPNGVTSIGNSAFCYCYSLLNVILPNDITTIGTYAFSDSQLQRMAIPNKITSIGNYMFDRCYSITSITIPKSVTSIGQSVFSECYALTNITLPNNLTSIGHYAFSGCRSITSITIPSTVTSIGTNIFSGCNSLANIIIPNGITSIGNYMFGSCYPLISITIPNTVTSIGSYAFGSCYSLANINIPSDVTSIGDNAFYNCQSLTSINIPSGVTSIDAYTFYMCRSLASITIPSSVTSIGNYAFYDCYSLASITIPNTVTSIGSYAFGSCIGVAEYHFLSATPPTLDNTNAFTGILDDCKIYVPSASLTAYQTATNWSTYASYMVGE